MVDINAGVAFEEVDANMDEEVILAERGLSAVPEEIAETFGGTATLLNLTENRIRNADNIEKFEYLETLVLDKNGISDLNWCCKIPTLRTLQINNNSVTDLPEFITQVQDRFINLTWLSMMRNPCCPCFWNIVENEQENEQEQYRRYREYVLYRLPKLQFLDATPVTDEERANAAKRGRFYGRKATPKKRVSSPTPTLNTTTPDPEKVLRRSSSSRKSFLGFEERERYDGSHSEGNRFIGDVDL